MGHLDGFGIVEYDYRMGVYEITNRQWDEFTAELGVPVTGNPSEAYDSGFYDLGTGTIDVPTNNTSWYEAAQFVNWLNTSTGHQAAYKFTGTQGQSDYTFATWDAADAWGGTNLYRHKEAFYFLPDEDEWFKAAYWNGTSIQDYATQAGDTLHQGDGSSGTGWNYYDDGYPTDPTGPWDVGSGSQELHGTFDMMGNIWEWVESPEPGASDGVVSERGMRGGELGRHFLFLARLLPIQQLPRRSKAETQVFASQVFLSPVASPCWYAGCQAFCCGGDVGSSTLYPLSLLPFALRRRRRRVILKADSGP